MVGAFNFKEFGDHSKNSEKHMEHMEKSWYFGQSGKVGNLFSAHTIFVAYQNYSKSQTFFYRMKSPKRGRSSRSRSRSRSPTRHKHKHKKSRH